MPNLILPSRFTSQPQYPAPIDWGNPLTNGLTLAVNHRLARHPASTPRGAVTVQSAVTIEAGVLGVGSKTVNGSWGSSGIIYPYQGTVDGSVTALTYAGLFTLNAAPNLYGAILTRVANGASPFTALLIKSTNIVSYWVKATTQISQDVGTATLVAGRKYLVVMTYNSVSGLRGYVNGVQDASQSANGNVQASTSGFYIGDEQSTSNRTLAATHFLTYAWNRALSAGEVAQLAANPWQIFQAPARRLYVPDSGVAPTFNAGWARGANTIIGGGVYA